MVMKDELREFVSSTLTHIWDGVYDAQVAVHSAGRGESVSYSNYAHITGSQLFVEFDVAVTAQKAEGVKGGAAVVAALVSLGSQAEASRSAETVSKIRFKVPISFSDQASTSHSLSEAQREDI